jgi:DNA-directed RNA polymerase specialized sigma24 family protein
VCYAFDSRGEKPSTQKSPGTHPSGVGEQGVRSKIHDKSVRHELIAMLPRLKRFADVLVGEKKESGSLLRRALLRMLSDQHRDRLGSLFDRWVFAEIYRVWLGDLRHQRDSLHKATSSEMDFELLFAQERGAEFDALTANFLGQLPPQQRGALLLVYGEGFDYEDVARVLDSNPDTIRSRLIRATTSLADRLSLRRAGDDLGKVRHRGVLFQATAR